MGTFFHPLTITGPRGEVTIDALVDSGATFSSVPAQILQELGIAPQRRVRLRLADGSSYIQDMGSARTALNGDSDFSPIIFGDNSPPSIGAVTLEILLLGMDPVGQKLVPVEGWRA